MYNQFNPLGLPWRPYSGADHHFRGCIMDVHGTMAVMVVGDRRQEVENYLLVAVNNYERLQKEVHELRTIISEQHDEIMCMHEQLNPWIPLTEESCPDVNGFVYIRLGNGSIERAYFFEHLGFRSLQDDTFYYGDVTHWMSNHEPLPPKETE